MKKYYFIVNPLSKVAKKGYIKIIENYCKKKQVNFTIKYSEFSGHIEEIAYSIVSIKNNFEKILIPVGGDGTINEVCKGLLKFNNFNNVKIGLIPSGTANVVAKELKIPEDIKKALEIIFKGKNKEIFLSKINENYFFIFSLGIGFDGLVVNNVNPNWKKLVRQFAYITAGLFVLPKLNNLPFFKIIIDDKIYTAQSVIINRTKKYAGNHNLFKQTDLSEKFFEVLIFKKVNFFNYIIFWINLLFNKVTTTDNLFFIKGNKIKIKTNFVIPAQIDGEKLLINSCEIEPIKKRLYFIVP